MYALNIFKVTNLGQIKLYFEPKTMKFIIFYDFSVHKIITFQHISPDDKKVNMVTPQFSLSFGKCMPKK